MTDIDRLEDELTSKIDYFRCEYSLTYAAVIGVLEIIKHDLMHENDEDKA